MEYFFLVIIGGVVLYSIFEYLVDKAAKKKASGDSALMRVHNDSLHDECDRLRQRVVDLESQLKSKQLVSAHWAEERSQLLIEMKTLKSMLSSASLEAEKAKSLQLELDACNERLDQLLSAEDDLAIYERDLSHREQRLDQATIQLQKFEASLHQRQRQINDEVKDRVFAVTHDIAHRDYLAHTPAFEALRQETDPKRMRSALCRDMGIYPPFNASADIKGESGSIYHVTLSSCTCPDFTSRKKPCKHMYRLALELGALLGWDMTPLQNTAIQLTEQLFSLRTELAGYIQKKQELTALQNKVLRERKDMDAIISSSSQSFPWLAKLFSDYQNLRDKGIEDRLRSKSHPALKAADEVRRIRREKEIFVQQSKMLEYQLHYYESLFPWLEEFKELSPQTAYEIVNDVESTDAEEYETLRRWLSPEEYRQLSITEKYQRALDNYCRRNKNKWDIGIEYERYIGYLCEVRGYKVQYSGACFGLEDMGRDLILSSNHQIFVIQCKRWSSEKTIHEKHIFQLFGSCMMLEQQNPGASVVGVFVTSASLSPLARNCADRLKISVYEGIPFAEYPMVKCNISKTGEKIYHLPFDQQYDRVQIDPKSGEAFVFTVLEAENLGFRRAHKWCGQ